MMATTKRLGKLLGPLAGSALLGAALYFGGETYQLIGEKALRTSGQIVGYALGVGIIYFIATFVKRFVHYVLLEGIVASALGTPVPRLLIQISSIIIYVAATAAVAGIIFKQDLTALWAASGVAGLVFGMALREMILDVFSGLAINLDQPIRIGDHVSLDRGTAPPLQGKVTEISWRSTRLVDYDNNVVVVPNSRIAAATITNMSLPKRHFEFLMTLAVDPDVPAERVVRILEAAAKEVAPSYALPDAPPPYIRVRAITREGVEYGVYINPTTETRFRARSVTLQAVLRHLAAAGIRPSWPTRVLVQPGDGAGSAPSADTVAALLAATAPFGGLAEADCLALAGRGQPRFVQAGETIVLAGEMSDRITLLVEGLLVASPGRVPAGQAPTETPLAPGALVGAEPMLAGTAHSRTVSARTQALVVELDQTALRALMAGRLDVATGISDRLAAGMARVGGSGDADRRDLAADILGHLRRDFVETRIRPMDRRADTAPAG
ncbi:mechanosensitive ion channel [Azospirillum sp. RWY-5-1]|uniref:Small-conductance mechanosensitive channel n=1 Tax=Azospirillum oleiclasticum TaxID=2735135 RepID=A0ABX2TI85_9PROT|nr:mechanosensitive ion channel family protein [Azospirillum oleiclasticum]NYZ17246.1 mechanosensitive ion channel [Azospirillum oleiclasticum]NYZ23470.1 mechanosensitive ion channel [Azospirillum oleiclasticum]